jgi:hypothetical protein
LILFNVFCYFIITLLLFSLFHCCSDFVPHSAHQAPIAFFHGKIQDKTAMLHCRIAYHSGSAKNARLFLVHMTFFATFHIPGMPFWLPISNGEVP